MRGNPGLLIVVLIVLLVSILPGCETRPEPGIKDGIKAPVAKNTIKASGEDTLKVVKVEVPGDFYGVLADPPAGTQVVYTANREPGSIRIHFSHPLALRQPLSFLLQYTKPVAIFPEGNMDPMFEEPASYAYSVNGNLLEIRSNISVFGIPGFMPQGIVTLVIPKGMKGADGEEMREDWYLLLGNVWKSPVTLATWASDIDPRPGEPTLVLPKTRGDDRQIAYVLRDGTLVRVAPEGNASEVLTLLRGENVEVLEERPDGYCWIRLYFPNKEVKWETVEVPYGQNIYETELVVRREGYIRREAIAYVPEPWREKHRVAVVRSPDYHPDGDPRVALEVNLYPDSMGGNSFTESSDPLDERQISMRTSGVGGGGDFFITAWLGTPMEIGGQEIGPLHPRYRYREEHWSQEEKATYWRFRQHYIDFISDLFRKRLEGPPSPPLASFSSETRRLSYQKDFVFPFIVDHAWYEWTTSEHSGDVAWFARRLAERLNGGQDRQEILELFSGIVGYSEESDRRFREALRKLFARYRQVTPLDMAIDWVGQKEFHRWPYLEGDAHILGPSKEAGLWVIQFEGGQLWLPDLPVVIRVKNDLKPAAGMRIRARVVPVLEGAPEGPVFEAEIEPLPGR